MEPWSPLPTTREKEGRHMELVTIEDVFVAGYGIDYAEKCRYLPYIGIVE